jgi:acetyl-CoA carboxylase biotin carboxyl carrier protein
MASRGGSAPDHRPLTDLVRQLGALLAELDLTEIEAQTGTLRVRVQRGGPAPLPLSAPALTPPPAAVAPVVDVGPTAKLVPIEAPMVGTFYRAPSPNADPYVREGDVVKEGQILCIIEAMKLMNEIESKASGRIAKALVENGQPVEYGQPLFLIEPMG